MNRSTRNLFRVVLAIIMLAALPVASGVAGAVGYYDDGECNEEDIPGPTEGCPEDVPTDTGTNVDGAMVAGDSGGERFNPDSFACRMMIKWSGSEFIGLSIWGGSQCITP